MRHKLFIPLQVSAQRLPDRPFLELGQEPLWRFFLRKLDAFDVFLDTDSAAILEAVPDDAALAHVEAYAREDALCGDGVSIHALIEHFLQRYGIRHEIVAQLHLTTPFLRPETLLQAFEQLQPGGAYDSVLGCTRLQARLWTQDGEHCTPLNHNPMVLRRSRDLAPLYVDNSTFYVFPAEHFRQSRNRVGSRPYFQETFFPENVTVNTVDDWERCLQLFEVLQSSVSALSSTPHQPS